MKKRILSGIQPTGDVHLGNYFGMMKPAIELQDEGETFLFIADLHALTSSISPDELRKNTFNVALDFLSCGLDPQKTVFFKQSDVPEVTELTWILSCQTSIGLLERCHSYKDKISKGMIPNHGLFAYPVLMAADILIYKSNFVPVGKDQKQHLEVTRDIAMRFNNRYGEILVIPEPIIREQSAVVPGIDGQKMSKSYQNTIPLFADEKEIKKKIMSIVTDSKGLNDPKNPDECIPYQLYKLFASESQSNEMANKLKTGGYGYGHAKKELFEIFWEHFKPFREKRSEFLKNPDIVFKILRKGAEKARTEAQKNICEIRKAIGLN
ncbi:MAG TPA: tryptophan--tRNA ligase [Victivallales bacterium]|nr:tryptophan--tRNA ligase [Victivallales bacterium]HPO90952.1 tryptophan--tRNA ligase [Victivallales bacterium]